MKKKIYKAFLWCAGSVGILFCCYAFHQPGNHLPRRYGFRHMVLPAVAYQRLPPTFPYQFEFSKHAMWFPNTSGSTEPYWINLYYPAFDATIQLTYKPVNNNSRLAKKYLEDAYKLVTKHQPQAFQMEAEVVETPHKLQATLVSIEGEVPTPYQFYATDSVHHFIRAALYFNTALHNDSLAPIIDFIKDDMRHMVYTLEWQNKYKRPS